MTHSSMSSPQLKRGARNYVTALLFGLVTLGAVIGVPAFAYFYGYTWLDWTMFGLLYVMTGLGITVGWKDRPGIEQQNKPRQGKEKGPQRNQQRPQRDQLDDQGVQRHMGHGDQKDAQGRRHPIEGGDQSDEGGPELDDKTEGPSRQLEPSR